MSDEDFIKNRISFQVAPYALYDVLKALSNDVENRTKIVVTKEDNDIVVMVTKEKYKKEDASNGDNITIREEIYLENPLFYK